MKLEKKHWCVIGIIVAVILVWYFFLRKKKKTESSWSPALGPIPGVPVAPINPTEPVGSANCVKGAIGCFDFLFKKYQTAMDSPHGIVRKMASANFRNGFIGCIAPSVKK